MRLSSLKILTYFLPLLLAATSCREDELVVPTEYEIVGDEDPDGPVCGIYIVNEGNMGSNKCTLDFYDYRTGLYSRNFYSEKNPGVIKELGDVGNDIGIYGDKMYVVVNCSHKVEVIDSRSGSRLGQIDIPNCRYVRFFEGKAYISSYVGPVRLDPEAPKGAVFEVDTTSLSITRKVSVGYQPEEMEFVDNYMYVANSGGYRAPDYDNTVSVVDMKTFRQVAQIPVGINLHHVKKDRYNRLWVSSRGDYENRPSQLYLLEKGRGNILTPTDTIDISCSNMAIHGDSIYCIATEWSNTNSSNTISYGIIDINKRAVVSTNFITDGTEIDITIPYGIAVHPTNGDIFLTDAKNYVSSGTLNCYDRNGKKKWSVRTGDIPAHIAFLYR